MFHTIIHPATALHNAFGWLMKEFVQDVPESISLCEFDCRKQQCTLAEWASCERRLKKGAGELRPSVPPEHSSRGAA